MFARLGATTVTETAHILEALRVEPHIQSAALRAAPTLEGAERVIWEMLDQPRSRDDLIRVGSKVAEVGDLLTALVALELRGLIKEEFNLWKRL